MTDVTHYTQENHVQIVFNRSFSDLWKLAGWFLTALFTGKMVVTVILDEEESRQ